MRVIRESNKSETPAEFYHFSQNNSGGRFVTDRDNGIGTDVIIQAHGHDEANRLAEAIGLYFNGCVDGRDCGCCGDRWSRSWAGDGDELPCVYGKPVNEPHNRPAWSKRDIAYVHYLDGRIEEYGGDE